MTDNSFILKSPFEQEFGKRRFVMNFIFHGLNQLWDIKTQESVRQLRELCHSKKSDPLVAKLGVEQGKCIFSLTFFSLLTIFKETIAFCYLFLISEIHCSDIDCKVRNEMTVLPNECFIILRSFIFSREVLNYFSNRLNLLALLIDMFKFLEWILSLISCHLKFLTHSYIVSLMILSDHLISEIAFSSFVRYSIHILRFQVLVSHISILSELIKVYAKVIEDFRTESWHLKIDFQVVCEGVINISF